VRSDISAKCIMSHRGKPLSFCGFVKPRTWNHTWMRRATRAVRRSACVVVCCSLYFFCCVLQCVVGCVTCVREVLHMYESSDIWTKHVRAVCHQECVCCNVQQCVAVHCSVLQGQLIVSQSPFPYIKSVRFCNTKSFCLMSQVWAVWCQWEAVRCGSRHFFLWLIHIYIYIYI